MEIELDNVTKTFGATRVLEQIDLRVDAGQRVGLVGPNGSGKTTLIRAIVGLIDVDGTLRVGGHSPFDDRRAIADGIAYVPQIAPEFATRVETLVETVGRARGRSTEAVAEITGDLGFDLEPHLDKPYRALSGGMKQKLLIGLAMADRPELLIMDEPTASLDASARTRFFERCRSMGEPTLLLCSHRLGEIRHLVDEIVELEAGAIRDVRDVGSFVADTGRVFIECQMAPEADGDAETMRELGLEPGADGHWSGIIEYEQKMATVRQLHDRFGEGIDDLVVEDIDELGGPSPSSKETHP